jgi:hypothetical protein
MHPAVKSTVRRRVIWSSDGERLHDTFYCVGEFCCECGSRNTWTAADRNARLCTDCGTLERLGELGPELASGFWGKIVDQLRAPRRGR